MIGNFDNVFAAPENDELLVERAADSCGLSEELRNRTHLCLALAAMLFLFPFSLNNFREGRELMGLGSLFIVSLLAYNSWCLSKRKTRCQGNASALVLAVISFIYICFNQQGALAVFWCYPSIALFYFILPENKARLVNLLALTALLPEVWEFLSPDLALRATATLILVSIISATFVNILGRQQRQLRELAIKDPLTGLFNRLLLDTFLERTKLTCERNGCPATLVTIDLDHFKAINDTYGHDIGDTVLSGLGRLLLQRLRRTDMVFRLGGEEFLVLLPDTDHESALEVAEQLRAKLRQTQLLPDCDRVVTASLGVATLKSGETWQSWLRRSDQAVYQAKLRGRDQVV